VTAPARCTAVQYPKVSQTERRPMDDQALELYAALDLAAKSGAVVDILKKRHFHGHPLDLDALTEAVADAMWSISLLITVFHMDTAALLVHGQQRRVPSEKGPNDEAEPSD